MNKSLQLLIALTCIAGRVEAQECKPVMMDGNSEAMIQEERQNYLSQLPQPLTTAEEATALKILREAGFAKYMADGCYVRAHLLSILLERNGIQNIFKTWILTPSYFTFFLGGNIRPKGTSIDWKYHVAVTYLASNGKQMVMDPAIDSRNALSLENWLLKLHCAPGTIGLRTNSSRWLPATVTTDLKIQELQKEPKPGFYGHGRNPFNGFFFSSDKDTPDYVARHLARDDVADTFARCTPVSSAKSNDLLNMLNDSSKTLSGPGCADVLKFFEARKLHWSQKISSTTAAN